MRASDFAGRFLASAAEPGSSRNLSSAQERARTGADRHAITGRRFSHGRLSHVVLSEAPRQIFLINSDRRVVEGSRQCARCHADSGSSYLRLSLAFACSLSGAPGKETKTSSREFPEA